MHDEHTSSHSGLLMVRVRLLHLHGVHPRPLLGAVTCLKPQASAAVAYPALVNGAARISHSYHSALVFIDNSNHLL